MGTHVKTRSNPIFSKISPRNFEINLLPSYGSQSKWSFSISTNFQCKKGPRLLIRWGVAIFMHVQTRHNNLFFPKSTREFSSQSTYYGGKLNANLISIFLPHPIQIPPATSHFLAIEGVISHPSNKERPFFDRSVLEGGGARYRFA